MSQQPPLSVEQRQRWLRFVEEHNPQIDPRSLRLMDELRMVAHLLYQINESSLTDAGLSYAQYRILQVLLFIEQTSDDKTLNPSEISRFQGTGRNTVSGLIRSLEEQGLIERELDPADRRKFNIRLTATGRQLVTQHAGRHLQIVDEIFRVLSPEEMEVLSGLLGKLNRQALEWREHAC